MIIKWICKRYKLYSKQHLMNRIRMTLVKLYSEIAKNEAMFSNKQLTKWQYYKKQWHIQGKIDTLKVILEDLEQE